MQYNNLSEIVKDKNSRIKYFQYDFPAWFQYHFGWDYLKPFQLEWLESLQSSKNTFITAFRASRKTTMTRAYVVWSMCYKKDPSIIVQSYEDKLSAEWVREVAKMLFKKSVVRDYGLLFPIETKKEDLAKKSLSNFETTNKVKIASKSLGQTLRGTNTFDMEEEQSNRPTLLILDDIDVSDSVKNPLIIDANENKILSETIGAMDPLNRKIIFLGNVIREDGIVPRFYLKYKNKITWNCFRQPLIYEGANMWPEVFIEQVIQTLKDDGEIAFNQNYLLIPYSGGETIIKRHHIKYSNLIKGFDRITIGIDPAISTKTQSDSFAITITGKLGDNYYVLESIELTGENKDPFRAVKIIKELYLKYQANIVRVETTAFQQVFAKLLQAENIAVEEIKPHKDKVTRLMEWQYLFEQGKVYFNPELTEDLINQLLNFPNVAHDDLVDSMVYSLGSNGKDLLIL